MNLNQSIQQGAQTYAAGARFGLTPIPRHIHNGTDAPLVYQPNITYGGIVLNNATLQLAPSTWTVANSATGQYLVTHNLNTLSYIVVVSAFNTDALATVAEQNANSFLVTTFSLGGSIVAANSDFNFLCFVINNRSQTFPSYSGT